MFQEKHENKSNVFMSQLQPSAYLNAFSFPRYSSVRQLCILNRREEHESQVVVVMKILWSAIRRSPLLVYRAKMVSMMTMYSFRSG